MPAIIARLKTVESNLKGKHDRREIEWQRVKMTRQPNDEQVPAEEKQKKDSQVHPFPFAQPVAREVFSENVDCQGENIFWNMDFDKQIRVSGAQIPDECRQDKSYKITCSV